MVHGTWYMLVKMLQNRHLICSSIVPSKKYNKNEINKIWYTIGALYIADIQSINPYVPCTTVNCEIMNLKEFLIGIGRLEEIPKNELPDKNENDKGLLTPVNSKEIVQVEQLNQSEILPEYKTIGDIFKYFYKNGYESLPPGIQINADNWKGNII